MAQKNDLEWLVTVPDDTNFTSALTVACKGNSKVANLLNYFLYTAAYEAKRQNLKKSEIEYVEVKRTLDDILNGLNRHNKTISKKTLHDRIVDLTKWGYLQSDGYHNIYRVFFKKIEATFSNPPEPEKPKIRGRHARKSPKEETSQPIEDGSFESKVKSTILTSEEYDRVLEQMVILTEEKSNLQSQMLDLTSQMSNLTSQMLDLTSSLSYERACREALEAKIAPLYSIDTVIDTSKLNGRTKLQIIEPALSLPDTKADTPEQSPLLNASLVEPPMSGKWDAEKVVQYTEFRNKRRYAPKMREAQLAAAKWLLAYDKSLTLDIYKQAFDERLDDWWLEHKKVLHVTDMKAKETNSGVMRLYAMLDRIEANKNKPNLRVVSSQKPEEKLPPKMPTREELRKMVY